MIFGCDYVIDFYCIFDYRLYYFLYLIFVQCYLDFGFQGKSYKNKDMKVVDKILYFNFID